MNNTQATEPVKLAELQFPAASPLCTLKQRVGIADVEITYSRPGMKGRQVFGRLVPFGKLWRAGANKATRINFSSAVKFGGHDIPAGEYALLAIPEKDEWTIIVSKDTELAGTAKYDEKLDVVRFKAKTSELGDAVENYAIEFDALKDESATLNFMWEKTKVSVSLEVDYIKTLIKQVEAKMSSSDDKKPYLQAALLFLDHNHNLQNALGWIDSAILERPVYPLYFFKAKIQAKLGDKQGAIASAKQSEELAVKADDSAFVLRTEDLIASLK